MNWFPEDASKTGHLIDGLFYLGFWITSFTFLLVIGILVYFLVRYREREGHKAVYMEGDGRGALALTLSLALAVFVLIDINLAYHDHKAWDEIWKKPDDSALVVKVKPEQFVWNAEYAGPDGRFDTGDDVKVINDIHIPLGRPVLVSLESKDVIHSFFLPHFRIKQDAVPGIITHMAFEAVKAGSYEIACAEHCGLGHYRMKGLLTVDSAQDFDIWLLKQTAPAAVP
jgi:cytochrome c oxidase subunit II